MAAPDPRRAGAQADRKTRRTMLMGFLLICSLSGVMHVIMVERSSMRLQRYEPVFDVQQERPEDMLLTGGGSITGEIAATSHDRFFVQVDGRLQPFLIGELEMPKAGRVLTVTYVGGRPPQALILSEPGSAPTLPEAYDLLHPDGPDIADPADPSQDPSPPPVSEGTTSTP